MHCHLRTPVVLGLNHDACSVDPYSHYSAPSYQISAKSVNARRSTAKLGMIRQIFRARFLGGGGEGVVEGTKESLVF